MSQPGVFAVSGRLDAASHQRVKAVLGAALAYAAARRLDEVVLDLSAVRFVDAGVLRLLTEAHESALGSGRQLRVAGAAHAVQRTLAASGLGRQLVGREDAESALPTRPAPTVPAKPDPTVPAKPDPAVPARPTPAVTVKPDPAVPVRPDPAVTAKPTPAATARPDPAVTAKPTPTATARPDPAVTAKPTPTARPTPAVTARPAPVVVGGESTDLERAAADRRRAESDQARLHRRLQQQVVDWEVRFTRRALLGELRHRLRTDPRALTATEFLSVADRPAVVAGILATATIAGGADGCALHVHDPRTGSLRSAGRRGLPGGLPAPAPPDDWPLVVDDITRDGPFDGPFDGRPATAALLAAGLVAVRGYLLRDGSGRPLGVLTMHFRRPTERPGDADLVARDAESALAQLPEPAGHSPA